MSAGTRRAALRTAWHTAKVRTHRHRLLIMLGTIAGLWMLLILHLAGIAAVGTATAAVLTIISGDHPFAQTVVILGGCILCLLLIVEWRGIMNAMTGHHALHRVEHRKLYLPSRRQVITTILLTLTLLLFLWQVLASGAAGPLAQTLVPGRDSVIIERTVAPVRRQFGARPGTVQLPSTLRRKISRYRYTEHRQFQIAADPINQTITGRFLTDDTGGTGIGGVTVAMIINGGVEFGGQNTTANGTFHFTGVTLTGGSIITIYSQNASNRAVTVSLGSGSSMTGVNLYKDHLAVRGNSGTALTNAHLAVADNGGSVSDTSHIYAMGDSSTTLQVKPDKELYVWPGYSYTPGGRVKTHDLEVAGTMIMGTNGLSASGSFLTSAGTFTTSTGVLLNGTGNSETFNPGSAKTFQNVTMNNGLVGYWPFDDGNGNKARDNSGNGNHGTLTNMETGVDWISPANAKIKFYNPTALDFDGSNDDVVTNSRAISGTATFTMAAWVKFSSLSITYAVPFWNGVDSTTAGFGVGYRKPSSRVLYAGWGSSTAEVTGVTSNDNQWYHVVSTFDGSRHRFYIDGVSQGSASYSSSNFTSGVTTFGNLTSGSTYPFHGRIDDVRIYDRALSASEVATLYGGSKSTGSGVYTLGSNLDVNGDLMITSGTLDAAGRAITVAGNVDIHGDYTKDGNSAFTLDGTVNQTISGSTVFNTFTKTVTASKILFFDYSARQSASGTLTMYGMSGQLLSIRSTRTGSAAYLMLDNDSGSQNIGYSNVKDNNASGGQTLECLKGGEGCVDSGHTTNWDFGGGATTGSGSGTGSTNAGEQTPPVSTDYKLRPDVINSGGADWSKSTRYLLSDSIGEAVIGHGAATNYKLDSGYRQPSSANLLTISCSATADLGSVTGIGQRTGSGTCTVYTDAFNGYQLRWSVPTGSGGTNTGKLISQYNDTIGQFTPAVANVPETWSVTTTDAEWGARVRSISTDTAVEWGTDNVTDKWLNISTTGRTIISRTYATPPAGSVEIVQYRAEIGSSVLQPNGTYSATVVLTVVGL
jgi:Concanavalin A-like lectin/glucanases superfamily